jgi:hypothetical protein
MDINSKVKELKRKLENLESFDFTERRLIRKVFKSIYSQLKHPQDKEVAREILRKTEWLDDE